MSELIRRDFIFNGLKVLNIPGIFEIVARGIYLPAFGANTKLPEKAALYRDIKIII
jgi:hypothetical protein